MSAKTIYVCDVCETEMIADMSGREIVYRCPSCGLVYDPPDNDDADERAKRLEDEVKELREESQRMLDRITKLETAIQTLSIVQGDPLHATFAHQLKMNSRK